MYGIMWEIKIRRGEGRGGEERGERREKREERRKERGERERERREGRKVRSKKEKYVRFEVKLFSKQFILRSGSNLEISKKSKRNETLIEAIITGNTT